MRHGYLATWHGDDYEASPCPDGTVRLYSPQPRDGFEEITPARHRRVIREDEATLRYVRTCCVWKDARFVVIGQHQGWVRLECLDPENAVAERLGLERFDVGVYQGWAPQAEVTELREEFF